MDFVQNVGRRSEIRGEFGNFVEIGTKSLNGNERNLLYRNITEEGDAAPRFADFAWIANAHRLEDGRGAAAIDIEGDGDLDLIVQSFERPAVLLVNQGAPDRHWLQLRLRGTRSNRDAIGARVVIEAGGRTQSRELASTEGYLTGRSLLVHFGLGAAERVDRLTVHWPSGLKTEMTDVAADRRIEIVEEGD